MYDFQRMNQVIIAYHAECEGEVKLSPGTGGLPPVRVRAGAVLARGTGFALADWLRSRGYEPQFMEFVRPAEDKWMQIDKEIDTRGLNCPLPILKAKKALTDMQSGQLLKVVSTDGGSLRDFQAFSKQTGNELVEQQTVGDEFIHVLRRR